MKVVDLKTFFEKIEHDWTKDREVLETICKFTKTRVNDHAEEFQFTAGSEQTFFMKALAEHVGAKNFFEIGTGRGTACYAISLLPTIEKIVTIDIIPFEKKYDTAINFKPAHVSNKDLYDFIPFKEKQKISFKGREGLREELELGEGKYDLCFIDGNHSDPRIIVEDYYYCSKLLKEDGIIVFDDYHPQKFAVKSVVDRIASKNDDGLKFYLSINSGHLFPGATAAKDYGMVIVTKRDLGF